MREAVGRNISQCSNYYGGLCVPGNVRKGTAGLGGAEDLQRVRTIGPRWCKLQAKGMTGEMASAAMV
jgi:hypothetical protein